MTGYSFVSTAARTGEILADLPLLEMPLAKQTIGRYESASATLPIDLEHAVPDWPRATRPWATHIIMLADNPADPAHGIPVLGWRILRRKRGQGDTVSLDLQTVEGYLDTRYIDGKVYGGIGQNLIIQDLVDSYVKDGPIAGIPIRVEIVNGGAGHLRDRTYLDEDDKSVYSALQDLMGVIDGPEWTIKWEWQSSPERITPVLQVGDRIGAAVIPGLEPDATFEMPGPVRSFELLEDFGEGRGANDVMATSSGQGDVRPQSSHHVVLDEEMPTVELRFTPSTSITETATLDGYAARAVASIANGSTSLSLSSDALTAPALGVDWSIGDDVGFSIGMPNSSGRPSVPSVPDGLSGVARAPGWEIVPGMTPTLTPILVSFDGAFDA